MEFFRRSPLSPQAHRAEQDCVPQRVRVLPLGLLVAHLGKPRCVRVRRRSLSTAAAVARGAVLPREVHLREVRRVRARLSCQHCFEFLFQSSLESP